MFKYEFETEKGLCTISVPGPINKRTADAVIHRAVSEGLNDVTELRAKLKEALDETD